MLASFLNVMTSSSESVETYTDDDIGHLHLLDEVDVLRFIMSGVEPVAEPGDALIRISYPSNFKYILGLHMAARGRAAAVSTLGGRWLLLLAFAARQCASNYSVWRDRKAVVMSPTQALLCTREGVLRNASADDADMKERIGRLLRAWLPSVSDLTVPGAPDTYSAWRAALWELKATAGFGKLYQKNFQIWHHRQRLLEVALATVPAELAVDVLASEESFEQYLQDTHRVSFAEFDERPVCHYVHSELDAKNYHVWLYRSWFVHNFSFLVRPPPLDAMRVWAEAAVQPFAPQRDWAEPGQCCASPYPASPLSAELEYTAALIQQDCLNNSAWCHRQYLVENDLLQPLLRQGAGDRVVFFVLLSEVNFALQWAFAEPCSECPFIYAQHWVELHAASCGRARRTVLQLADYVQTVLHAFIVPRAEQMEETMLHHLSLDARDADKQSYIASVYEHRCQALLDSCHQPAAALFALLFFLLERSWSAQLSEHEKEEIRARAPAQTYAYDGVPFAVDADTPQWEPAMREDGCRAVFGDDDPDGACDDMVSLLIQREAMALATAKGLLHDDPIRYKYWKSQIHTVLNRLY